jgi:hypothetical protein
VGPAFLACLVVAFLVGTAFLATVFFVDGRDFFVVLADVGVRRVALATACFAAFFADVLLAAIDGPLVARRVLREHGAERIGGYPPGFKQPRCPGSEDAARPTPRATGR